MLTYVPNMNHICLNKNNAGVKGRLCNTHVGDMCHLCSTFYVQMSLLSSKITFNWSFLSYI